MSCEEALEHAGRTAPSWAKAAWLHVMGIYSPDVRWEANAIRGFVSQVAELLARVCSCVLHRTLVSQRLVAITISDWEGGEHGEYCAYKRRFKLILDNGLTIDINIGVVVSMDGSLKAIHVSSEKLGCSGEKVLA